jgi:hypothetical protein
MLFRFILYVIVGWLILRILRSFLSPGQGQRNQRRPADGPAKRGRRPEDFSRENIKDAEFEDLTPPPRNESNTPPKP